MQRNDPLHIDGRGLQKHLKRARGEGWSERVLLHAVLCSAGGSWSSCWPQSIKAPAPGLSVELPPHLGLPRRGAASCSMGSPLFTTQDSAAPHTPKCLGEPPKQRAHFKENLTAGTTGTRASLAASHQTHLSDALAACPGRGVRELGARHLEHLCVHRDTQGGVCCRQECSKHGGGGEQVLGVG